MSLQQSHSFHHNTVGVHFPLYWARLEGYVHIGLEKKRIQICIQNPKKQRFSETPNNLLTTFMNSLTEIILSVIILLFLIVISHMLNNLNKLKLMNYLRELTHKMLGNAFLQII